LLLKVLVVEGVDRNPPLEDVRINGRKMLRWMKWGMYDELFQEKVQCGKCVNEISNS
jgi:hypothetical protein